MGKRMQVADSAKTKMDAAAGFGERLFKQDDDSRICRRLLAFEKLDVADKRQVLQLLDSFIERGQLQRKVQSCA